VESASPTYDGGVSPAARRLLVVEDEPLVSALLRETFEGSGFTVAVAASVPEATRVADAFDPDIAVLDVNLGRRSNGVDLAFILHRTHPGIALMLLTKHPDLRTAGFSKLDLPPGCGFLRKDGIGDSTQLVAAIEALVAEQSQVRDDHDPSRPLSGLTRPQIEVLRMVAQGFTNAEIARRRQTSVRAVEHMLTVIFHALGIDTDSALHARTEAVRIFIGSAGIPSRS
jgi:DNA-binding NarL/FixJ family response regulator